MIKKIIKQFASAIIAGVIIFSGVLGTISVVNGATIPVALATFQTSLQSSISASDTSMTLVTGTDKAGNTLSGYICFTIDEGSSVEEFTCGTTSGTAVTSMIRGIDPVDGDLEVTALKKRHGRGASVKVTTYPVLGILGRILNGIETIPNKLSYASHPTFSSDTELVDKKYADDLAIAGAPDASTTVKGLVEEATSGEIDSGTATGGTSARLFTNPSALATSIYGTRLPSATEKEALVGTSGTPSTSNKYVTNDDVSSAGASGKIVRATGTALPALDGTNLTGVALSKGSYTASGAIDQNDTVYVSAANTVKTLYPSAQGTGSAVTTAPSHTTGANKALPLSTGGLYINFNGGDRGGSGAGILYAQVRTINAGETDFANGAEATVYSTGNGTRVFDVKSIGTDKFMVIFQADTAGAGAGIKVCVLTVSGTTITKGAITTVEATGGLQSDVALAKVDTDKAIIYYSSDADNDLYAQVLTVSGTTITTNTPVLVKAQNRNWHFKAIQLATNSTMVVYNSNTGILYGSVVTVSGTVPTIGAEQTIRNTSADYYLGLDFISSTKALLVFSEQTTPINDQASILTISGSTITKGSDLAIGGNRITYEYGVSIIGTKYVLLATYSSNTNIVLSFLDISGATPTSISTQSLTSGDTSGIHNVTAVVKVSPWTYMVTGSGVGNADYIIKLTVNSTARIGVAESAISDTASGNILIRYLTQTLAGITLTAGSLYYVDDTGQPTVNSSLTAPTLGIAISTTKILLQ